MPPVFGSTRLRNIGCAAGGSWVCRRGFVSFEKLLFYRSWACRRCLATKDFVTLGVPPAVRGRAAGGSWAQRSKSVALSAENAFKAQTVQDFW